MKKKLLTTVLAIGVAAGVLAGCGGEKETTSVVGKWSLTKIQMEGMDEAKPVEEALQELADETGGVSEEEFNEALEMFTGMTLTINEDGTMEASLSAYGMTQEGTWEETGDNTYSLSPEDGSEALELTLDGDELIAEEAGEKIIFEK